MKIKTGLIYGVALLAVSGIAPAAPPPLINPVGLPTGDGATLGPTASVDDVLDALQARGKTLGEFVANVRLTETDTVMATSTTRTGKVWFQLKPNGDARLHVLFDKKAVGEKPPTEERKEYLLNDGWLIDRDYRARTEVNRQVAPAGEKVNLFQLGKGPFPLPIGQDKKEVHSLFDVTHIPPGKDDPAGSIHLQLKPKANTDFDHKFTSIDVWVDPATRMPVRIETLDKNQTADRQTDLENVQVNPKEGLKDTDFSLPPIDGSGWNRHDEPMGK